MTVFFELDYALPTGDLPLTHARILHSGNWFSGGTATAQNTASGFASLAPLNTLTYERWKPSANPSTWEYDHGSAVECDCCCVAAHTMGDNEAKFQVQYYDGSGWMPLIFPTLVPDNSPVMAFFEPVTAQRWRIRVSEGTEPEIGVVKFGKALQMERPLYGGHTPIPLARQTILRSNYSETGEYLGRTKQRTYQATSYSWQHLTSDWTRDNWPDLQRAIEAEPFFIAWRPSAFGDVGFCQVDEVPVPSNMGIKDLMEVSMSVRARGYD